MRSSARLADQIGNIGPRQAQGERRRVEKQQKVRPWWRTGAAGNVVLSVYYGTKPIEFEKGKAGVAVPSKEKLRYSGQPSLRCLAIRAF